MIWPKPEEIKSDDSVVKNAGWSHEMYRIPINIIHGRHRLYYSDGSYLFDTFVYYNNLDGEHLKSELFEAL